jgi:hypothetical protein
LRHRAFEGCIVDSDEDNCAEVFNPDQRDSDGSCAEPGEDPTDCGDLRSVPQRVPGYL